MRIGVISDTHDNLQQVAKAVRVFQKLDAGLIIHCGDWVSPFVPQYIYSLVPKLAIPIKSVFGNNEGDHYRFLERKAKEGWDIEFQKEILTLEMDGKKIVVYHGSNKNITEALITSKKHDVVLTGHTHDAVIEEIGGVLHINPGSAAGYCRGTVTDKASVALYDSLKHSAKLILLKDVLGE